MQLLFKVILQIALIIYPVKIIFSQQVKIDHVICVVNNIDKAVKEYEDIGFTVKKGRLHKNGLINAHIKFSNQSSFELMSLKGTPGDEIARTYKKLLSEGEGGVYIALTGMSISNIQVLLSSHNIQHNVVKGKNWSYVTFPEKSSLAHFFFIDYHILVKDDIKTLKHSNKIAKISTVYTEGDEKTLNLLKNIGLEASKVIFDSKPGKITEFITPTGNISVVHTIPPGKRYRVKAIDFANGDASGTIKIHFY